MAKGMPRRFTEAAAAAFLVAVRSDDPRTYSEERSAPPRPRVLDPSPDALANSLRRAE